MGNATSDREGAFERRLKPFLDRLVTRPPRETELLSHANRLVGGDDAVLVIDDIAMPKGERSVGVAAQYASSLGKTASCQTRCR